jgi:hypothetical protein
MFDTSDKRDKSAIVKSIHKTLPYSISFIGGLEEHARWKTEQAIKEEAWQHLVIKRKETVVANMENGSLINKQFQKSDTTETWKEYKRKQKEILKKTVRPEATPAPTPKQSIISHIYNWFLTIKF